MHREETVSTLKFGQLCKTIKNIVKSNTEVVDEKGLLKQYRMTIAELRMQVEDLQAGSLAVSFLVFPVDSMVPGRAATGASEAMYTEKVELESRVCFWRLNITVHSA
jgi:hypothetical protein